MNRNNVKHFIAISIEFLWLLFIAVSGNHPLSNRSILFWQSPVDHHDVFATSTSTSLYADRPVPAGINLPIITFSFNPRRLSMDPAMLASVSTLVVSKNDAALIKLSVLKEALVIPRIRDSATAGCRREGKAQHVNLPESVVASRFELVRSGCHLE